MPNNNPTAAAVVVDPKAANRVQTHVQREGKFDTLTKEKKRPFCTTKKGIIIVAVAVLVIVILAVVGGVVGSRKSSSSPTDGQDMGSNVSPTPSSFGLVFGPTPTPSSLRPVFGPTPIPSPFHGGVGAT